MKKISFIVATILFALSFVSCASTSSVSKNNVSEQPWWTQVNGRMFDTREADKHPIYHPAENGLFACGMSEDLGSFQITTQSANMSARTELARLIANGISEAMNKESATGQEKEQVKQKTQSIVSSVLKGVMIVEGFEDERKGRYYSLAFISEKNLKASFSNIDDEKIKQGVSDFLRTWDME